MQEETRFVTNDKWVRESGWLDPTDRQILAEASAHGASKVRVIRPAEMVELMKKEEPLKFNQFHRELEKQVGIRLTPEKLVEFVSMANERKGEFTDVVKTMTLGQAAQLRAWRSDSHMTWRSLARAAWREKWFGRNWGPPENQLAGMVLCEKAAKLLGENYMQPPWN